MPCLNSYLPIIKRTVTVASADWDETTKTATVTADWAIAGMSVTVSPRNEYSALFRSLAVQGVYCTQVINGYVQFVTGTHSVMSESIELEITAFNDGRGAIVNTSIVPSLYNGLTSIPTYDLIVENGDARITGIKPNFKWEIPPYDGEGHEITAIGVDGWGDWNNGSITNDIWVSEVYITNNVKKVFDFAFYQSPNLKKVYIGKQVTYIGDRVAFCNCTALSEIEFERGRTEILVIDTLSNYSTFGGCTALRELTIPENVKLSGHNFRNCTGLKTVRFESPIAMSGYASFNNCPAIEDCTFTSETPVSNFGDMLSSYSTSAPYSEGKYIFVPYDKLTAYTTANNWSSRAYYMNGIGKFTAGATLPAQTSDTRFNLTWYATKADLKAGTNAISVAPDTFDNGYGEIYCTKTAVA